MHTKIVVFAPMALYERNPSDPNKGYMDWVSFWGWEPNVVNMRAKNDLSYYTPYKIIAECTLT